jgi:hypothetical protein
MKTNSRKIAFALTLFALLLTANLHAQNPNGALRGEVQDASGARVAGARVAVEAAGSSFTRAATTDDRGEFRIEGLRPGSYRVTVTAKGFGQATADVAVAVSVVRDIAVTLRPESARETVNVQGTSSSITTEAVDTASAVHGGVVGRQDLASLPLPARSFANIAYLVPGTEPVEPSDPTKARITAVSTGGSSGLNNELSVDGADNSDDWIGGFLQNFSPDGIQEFAVRTSNEDADTGWTTAGSVVITTKHGTNDWHGDAAFYDRQAALNARFPIENPAPDPKQPFSRQNYVATLGGPVAKDKVWVFTSFENVHENASIAYNPASTTQFDALAQLASQGLIPGVTSIAVPSSVPIPFRDYIGSLRFDWAQSPKSQWFLRTSQDSYLTHNALVQQATLPSTGLTTHNNYWNTVVSNTYSFSPNWLGTLVLDASLLHLTQTRNSNLGFALQFPFSVTALTVSGFETFGDNHDYPLSRSAQSGQVPVSLRSQPHCRKPHHQVWLRLHSRTCAQRRLCLQPGDPLYIPAESHGLPRQPGAVPKRSCGRSGNHSRRRRHLLARRSAPRLLRPGFMAGHAPPHRQLRLALPNHFRALRRFGPKRA